MPAMCFATPSAGVPDAAAALGWPFVFAEPMLEAAAQYIDVKNYSRGR
jgi:hypothetical protein